MINNPKFRAAMAVIAVFAVLLLAVAPGSSARPGVEAQSMETETLVVLLSNFDKEVAGPSPSPSLVYVGDYAGGSGTNADYKKAVSFKTGSNEAGYTLEKLTAKLFTEATYTPSVAIHADDNGSPSATVSFTLTVEPSTISGAPEVVEDVKFNAPANSTLAKDSTYWAVFSETSTMDKAYFTSQSVFDGTGSITGALGWVIESPGQNKTGDSEWEELPESRAPFVKLDGQVNPNPGVTISTPPTSVTEGSTATYMVVLESEPENDVTVTANSSNTDAVTASSVTFTSGTSSNWATAQMVTLTGVEDDNTIREMVTITHEVTSSDLGYNGITVDQFEVTVSDDDTPGVTVSETLLTVTEGDSVGDTYTLVLTTQPAMGDTVTITPSSTNDKLMFNPTSVSFTSTTWNSPQTVTVTAGVDDDLTGESSTITHNVTGYNATAASVSVAVTDNDMARVDVSTMSITVGEGSSSTYTIELGFKPSGNVTVTIVDPTETDTEVTTEPTSLTFTDTNWHMPQTVTVNAGHDDADTTNDTATITHTVAGANYGSAMVSEVAVTVTDDDSVGVSFSPTALTIAEGASGTYKVKLNSQPTADVTVTPTGAGLTISPSLLTFTPITWSTEMTVTVTASQDKDLENDVISITHAATSGDTNYSITSAGSVDVTVTDNDMAGITVNPTSITPGEGDAAGSTYTVVLDFQPSSNVRVTITGPSGSDLTIDETELLFTTGNWETAQPVKVTAASDDDSANDMHTIAHAVKAGSADEYLGLSVDSVSVEVDDDDTDGVTITPTSLGTITEGATTSYQVKLDTVPNAIVRVKLTVPTDGGVSVGGSDLNSLNELIFGANTWSNFQTVRVTAVEDFDAFDNTGEITHTVTGYGGGVTTASDVTFSVDDNDAAEVLITDATDDGDGSFSTTINEGSTTTYKLRLSSQPFPDTDVVTVTINVPMGTDITSDETSFTFDKDNWNGEKSVTLTAADDADGVNDELTITHNSSGADYTGIDATNLDVTISDNDTSNLVFSENTISVDETDVTETANYTVKLATQPTAAVTVTMMSDNGNVTFDDDPLEFTTSNWNMAQTVTLNIASDPQADDESATITHNASGGDYQGKSGSVTVNITDDEEARWIITPTTITVTEGQMTSFTVTLSAQPTSTAHFSVRIGSNEDDVSVTPGLIYDLTNANWSSGQQVHVTSLQDDDGEHDDATVTLSVSGAPEFLPAKLDEALPTFTVNITDDDPKGLEFRESDFNNFANLEIDIDEEETKSYGVKLKTQPTGDVEVTPRSVSGHVNFPGGVPTLTFTTGNWDTFQEVTIKARHDNNAHDPTDQIDHTITGYGALDVDEVPGTLTIDIEDPDTTEFVLDGSIGPISIEVTEGIRKDNAFYVNLSSSPVNPDTGTNSSMTLSFDVSSGLTVSPATHTFNSSNWDTVRTFRVRAEHDVDGVNQTLEIIPKGAGANYDGLSGDKITVTVIDDDTPDLEISQSSVTVGETATLTNAYTIKPTTKPTGTFEVTLESDDSKVTVSPTTLNFDGTNWEVPQSVSVNADADDDAFHNVATISHEATMPVGDTREYDGVIGPTVEVTVTDDDTPRIKTTPMTLDINEPMSGTATATYIVTLATRPVHPGTGEADSVLVTIVDPTSPSDISADPATVTLNSSNWNTGVEVTVSVTPDDDTVKDTGTITHTASGADYGSAGADTVVVSVVDTDSPNVLITPSNVDVTEGTSNGSYEVKLSTQPASDVRVTPRSNHTEVTFSPATLTFTNSNWNTAQSVTVTAAEDADAAPDEAEISHTSDGADYTGLSITTVNVTVAENDTLEITVAPLSLSITEVEGGTGTAEYTVRLSAAPSVPSGGSVTVQITASGDDNVSTNPTSLTFNASQWTAPTARGVSQSVTVNVSDDADAVADMATLTHTVTGADYQTAGITADPVTVNVTDTDTAGVTISVTTLTIDEESTDTYTIKLTSQPTGDVTVQINDPANTVITATQSALTFTPMNWNSPQPVTVNALADEDANEDTGTITHEITTGPEEYPTTLTIASVEVTSTDGNTRGVEVTETAVEVEEGGETDTYQVRLDTQPSGTVTITPESDNTDVSISPSFWTFDEDDWDDYKTFTVESIQDADAANDSAVISHTVTDADYGDNNVEAADVGVTVFDGDNASASVSTEEVRVNEGQGAGYTIVLDSRPVGGDVTVTLTPPSNPDITVDPAQLMFTSGDWDQAQTITVSAAHDTDTKVDTGTITHAISGANFTGATLPDVAVIVIEDDMAMISIEPTQLTIGEGKAATYTVVLGTEPSGEVTIRIGVDNGDVRVSPSALTFTTTDWNETQVVTISADADADAMNDTATISHTASGAEYEGELGANVTVLVVEDGTSVRDTSSFLRSSSCDNTLALTWNSPIADDAGAIDMYRIEWSAGEESYSSTNMATVAADATSYMLEPLNNGQTYRVRVTALDDTDMPLWTREINAVPSDKTCISEVNFGNILADSTPVIIEVVDPQPGTRVNMRYRSLNPGVWSEVQSKVLEEDETSVTFDIRGLNASNRYEVQSWLGSPTPPPEAARGDAREASVVQTVFTTGDVPAGSTYTGGGGGGSRGGRISRIEPSIRAVTIGPGDLVRLSVQVWGRQNLLANDLADKAPGDGRPEFTWFSDAGGSFSESDIRADWRNGLADDREVRFTAPSDPGTFVIRASLDDAFDCLAAQDGETADEADARCSAEIEVTVRRPAYVAPEATVPVNPSGPIPEVLADTDGVAYAVFTPVDGGSFVGEGYWVTAGAGAVADGEYIGLSMTPIGEASNMRQTWHRYTLAGQIYEIGVVDANEERVSDYILEEHALVCVPMPDELRTNIADIVLISGNGEDDSTVLSTRVRVTLEEGVVVCGNLSSVPTTITAGKIGPPVEPESEPSELEQEEELPDTGATAPGSSQLILLLILGAFATLVGLRALTSHRRKATIRWK